MFAFAVESFAIMNKQEEVMTEADRKDWEKYGALYDGESSEVDEEGKKIAKKFERLKSERVGEIDEKINPE